MSASGIKGWNLSAKAPRACQTFPLVWAAISGTCQGRGRYWRYIIAGSFGRKPEFACEACARLQAKLDAMYPPEYQRELRRMQDAAGVEDYRHARARRDERGIPVLVVGDRRAP